MTASRERGSAEISAISSPANFTESARALQPPAAAQRAGRAHQVLGYALADQGTLGIGERMQHIPLDAGERALISRLFFALQGAARLLSGVKLAYTGTVGCSSVYRIQSLILLGQFAPRTIHVISHRDQNVAQALLPVPRRGPRGDGALPDAPVNRQQPWSARSRHRCAPIRGIPDRHPPGSWWRTLRHAVEVGSEGTFQHASRACASD